MSDNKNKEEFKPFIPADKITPEFTVSSVIMGIILAVVFAIVLFIIVRALIIWIF